MRAAKRMSLVAAAVLAAMPVALPSAAQALMDPTRPPNWSAIRGAESAPAPSGPALQSILIAPGRRSAVIDGREMKMGDRIGDARIVAIEFDSVRLQEGRRTVVMKLLPDIENTGTKIGNAEAKGTAKGEAR